jgi:alkylhydroperoxidase family enzyme
MLLDEIEWSEPILPPVSDPEWEAEIKRRGALVTEADKRISPSRWLRETGLGMMTYQPTHIPRRLLTLGALVTAQENACRYCYGANRALLKIFGYPESVISRIERDMRVAELDEKEHGFIAFCRNLARSRPRPARADREALLRLGYSPLAVSEMAYLIAMGCFYNRLGVLLACPPEHALERIANGVIGRVMGLASPLMLAVMSWRARPNGRVLHTVQALSNGPFGPVVAALEGLPAGGLLRSALDGALASTQLPRPTRALMFAVVARTLGCRHTEAEAKKLLAQERMDEAEIEEALQTLQSGRLEPSQAGLLAWTRDTVYYQTPAIQQQTRGLARRMGDTEVLEAIGTAALANATVRIAMLLE